MAFTIDKITVGKAYNKDGREVVDLIIDNNYLGSNATLQSMVAGDEELNNWQIGQENLYGLQGVENTPEAIKVAKQRLLDIVVAYEEELATQAQSELEEAAAETIETGETGTQVDDTEPTAPVIAPADTSKKPLTEQDLEREGFITKNLLQQKQLHIKELLDFDFLSDDEKNAIKKAMIEKGFAFDDENYLTKRFQLRSPMIRWNDTTSSLILGAVNEVRLGKDNAQPVVAIPILGGAEPPPPPPQGPTGTGAGAGTTTTTTPPTPPPAPTPTEKTFQQLADAFVANANQDTYNAVASKGEVMAKLFNEDGKYLFVENTADVESLSKEIKGADDAKLETLATKYKLALKREGQTAWHYTTNIDEIVVANKNATKFTGAGRDFNGDKLINAGGDIEISDLRKGDIEIINALKAYRDNHRTPNAEVVAPILPNTQDQSQEQGEGR
ncbi:MAG: hypothetical protein ACK5BE_06685 [Alphaproteobacteria bacterium]